MAYESQEYQTTSMADLIQLISNVGQRGAQAEAQKRYV